MKKKIEVLLEIPGSKEKQLLRAEKELLLGCVEIKHVCVGGTSSGD